MHKYIERFLEDPQHEYYIPCKDAREQENLRVALFYRRRRMGGILEATIGISKKTIDDKLYVVLFKREYIGGYRMVDGKLIPDESGANSEMERRIALMKQDGFTAEEIENLLKEEDTDARPV